ncbi:mevalonate kinase [Nitrincola tibetensis]|uniref:Mevalonate kinase n=1 Tax=Nitrincola tibetensis TaxID=2219697 RepID=A0A364NNJ0_9GAMM|nr:mevalonate kinase [Nitrincola tibetensis]RAU18666.1 mevalonate kinase [Nitrincola tibetensis]
MMSALAPGKLILSGEHSVVYGAPAVSLALRRHTRAEFEPNASGFLEGHISHASAAFPPFPIADLIQLKHRLDARYQAFIKGDLSVQQLLDHPSQLLLYTLAVSIGSDIERASGTLHVTSDLLLGSGMGSSASVIACLLSLFGSQSLTLTEFVEQVRFCERLQHGRGSLIDAASVSYGGIIRLQQQEVLRCDHLRLPSGCFWIYTGAPSSSTGECVEQVRKSFAQSSIWQEFAGVTHSFIEAQPDKIPALIQQNQRLLERIGVVPSVIQSWVRRIEQAGGAAKIAGAGCIRGPHAGLLLVWLPEGTPNQLDLPAHYIWGELEIEYQGAYPF